MQCNVDTALEPFEFRTITAHMSRRGATLYLARLPQGPPNSARHSPITTDLVSGSAYSPAVDVITAPYSVASNSSSPTICRLRPGPESQSRQRSGALQLYRAAPFPPSSCRSLLLSVYRQRTGVVVLLPRSGCLARIRIANAFYLDAFIN